MKQTYQRLIAEDSGITWSHLIQHNAARPRAVVSLWLICHDRLATKARLHHLGLLNDEMCGLCNSDAGDINHLVMNCQVTKCIWRDVLHWLKILHQSACWSDEIKWIASITKGKRFMANMVKIAIAETVYDIWRYRNNVVFGTNYNVDITTVTRKIIDTIVIRGWSKPKYRDRIAHLMM